MIADRSVLKSYAPQARKDFIQAMTNRAARFGVTRDGIAAGQEQGQLFLIEGQAFSRQVGAQRARLIERIDATSFDQTMEAAAYTWFNRFLAIRYMELHGYFDHGLRVLSHPRGVAEPEILQQAQHLNLPGLNQDEVVALKLDGAKDDVLYRRILIAQCNDLNRAMPFLFERIDDETELLLPDNLLQSDSLIRKLVEAIPESDWAEIEIIGWLYQFYIAEKKDQVMGKVVKSEDIPAATQLFTPNWIVKYMVQNSLGAQWLATYPQSPLKSQMAYYIRPAEQTVEVQAQLAAITPKSLDPEAITLIDPAVGSGHILVEAYDLFRAIYLERGYSPRDAARAILAKNLYGLDIDDRAAQMAGFALLMKARADDRALLSDPPALNVMSLTDAGGWNAAAIADALLLGGRVELLQSTNLMPETLAQPTLSISREERAVRAAVADIVELFDGAKTFGSLITVPEKVTASLPLLEGLLAAAEEGDLLRREARTVARQRLMVLVRQAKVLGQRYDCVVANPPYMESGGMNDRLKKFAQLNYPISSSDILAAFIERFVRSSDEGGRISMVTRQNWMFTSSFVELREFLIVNHSICGLVQIGYNSFPEMNSKVVQAVAIVFQNASGSQIGSYVNLNDAPQSADKRHVFEEKLSRSDYANIDQSVFSKLSGMPIAYMLSSSARAAFLNGRKLSDIAEPKAGISTGDNDRFQRRWPEVNFSKIAIGFGSRSEAISSGRKWFPCNSGGVFRKWFGNNEIVINWERDGQEIREFKNHLGKPKSAPRNLSYQFKPGITWTKITTGIFSARNREQGFLFDDTGRSAFSGLQSVDTAILGLLSSKVGNFFLKTLNPTMSFTSGDVGNVPISTNLESLGLPVDRLIAIARRDWNSFEISWDFECPALLSVSIAGATLQGAWQAASAAWAAVTKRAQDLEEANNRLLIDGYSLADELNPDVPLNEITLTCNPHYRYGGDQTDAQREDRLRSDTMRELISYGVGLMMGRYSLAAPGLIYADAGNIGFDPGRYGGFPADEDGIVPVTEEAWFDDDAATRMEEFLKLAWPAAPVGETLATLTGGLTQGKGGDPREELRAYFSKSFYKDHLQTYRNRPIYWLFSSGKSKAFEALVYLHRYNESTLARMRMAYVAPLMGKMQQRIADLEADVAGSSSSAEKTRKGREREKLLKQLLELRAFDEELRHLADQRIALDLDDGVKVNYGRFGNLLAAKDKVCGKDKDD
jgi:type II restriction/modification system DNA methylase subunit YeeA